MITNFSLDRLAKKLGSFGVGGRLKPGRGSAGVKSAYATKKLKR